MHTVCVHQSETHSACPFLEVILTKPRSYGIEDLLSITCLIPKSGEREEEGVGGNSFTPNRIEWFELTGAEYLLTSQEINMAILLACS